MVNVRFHEVYKNYPISRTFRQLFANPAKRKFLTALEDVSLEISKSHICMVLGPNGAGKTTLIKILATLVLPDKGSVKVAGHDIETEAGFVRSVVGYANNDERSFYWRLTGRQNLRFFCSLYDMARPEANKRIDAILEMTGLGAAANRRYESYSTGMRQMLAFARAMINDSKLILADEPTRSLDPVAAEKIRRFIKIELCEKQGKTVIWSSHNISEAADFGNELIILKNGRKQISGDIGKLCPYGAKDLARLYDYYMGEEYQTHNGSPP